MGKRIPWRSAPVSVAIALLGTLILNFAMFVLLPRLVHKITGPDNPATAITAVAVPPPPRIVPPQQPATVKKPLPTPKVKKNPVHKARSLPTPQLHLKLQLRPQLSDITSSVTMPPVQFAALKKLPDVFASTDLDKPLSAVSTPPFIYPLRAKRLGIEGWVKVKLLVSPRGRVEKVKILAAKPAGVFEKSVERGVRLWRFTAGTVDGMAVRSWVVTTVRFELE